MYQNILFDLDGTITDPGEGITNSVSYALKKWNISVSERSELYKFIGPPLQDSFRDYYNFGPEDCAKAVAYYREYYGKTGIFENKVYAGVENMLKELRKRQCTAILATSKPEQYAIQILEHFGLKEYFTFICGSNMDGTRTKKSDVIQYALHTAGILSSDRTVMVGDRWHDISGAIDSGLDSIGVLYGYGSADELRKAGATYLCQTPDDILTVID